MSGQVAFVDCETLGLDADIHPVWEVGLILPDGRELEWQIAVTDREIALAHPKALEISRFEERYGHPDADDPLEPEDFVNELWHYIPEGCHLAGAVVSFDEERLRRLMWKHGYSPRWHYHTICCETLAVGFLAARGEVIRPPWDSDDLSTRMGIDVGKFDRHTALGDARWASELYGAAMAATG